jgi:tetratricopeptide (TPR) repeat protein
MGALYRPVGAGMDPDALPLAHDAYRRAVTLAPTNGRLYAAWGQVYLAQERPQAAVQQLEMALALDNTDGLVYRMRGDVALAQGDVGGALQAYRQAVRWSPDSVLAHVGLARSYRALGQPQEALAALQRAADLNPQHPAVEMARREITSGVDVNQLNQGDNDEN